MRNLRYFMLAAAMAASVAMADTTVTTVDGATHTGRLAGLNGEGVMILVAGKPVSIAAIDILEVRLHAVVADPMNQRGRAIVRTRDGGLIPAEDLVLSENGRLTGQSANLGEFAADVDCVRSILMPDRRTTPNKVIAEIAALPLEAVEGDCLVVCSDEKQLVPVGGVLGRFDRLKIAFTYGGADRTIDTAKVSCIRVATVGDVRTTPRGVLLGVGGERLPFAAATVDGDRLALRGTPVGDVALERKHVASIEFVNARIQWLADLTPTSVKQGGTFDTVFPWRRNRSAANKPICLDGVSYGRGLGLHSRCELTYTLGGAYETFVALVGIDDAARPRGHAVVTVIGDDKPLIEALTFTGRPDGKANAPLARPLRVDVCGIHTLTIDVDFGENLDVGDHVNLAEARLVRK